MKNQALSIEQIFKMQNLGFDVIKNSSAIVIIKENGTFIVNKEMIEKNIFGVTDKIEDMFYSMTIGDIMECLPEKIEEQVLNIFAFGETWSVGWEDIQYYGSNTLIDALFETLKWSIKEKHIEL